MASLTNIPCVGIVVNKISEYTVAALYRGFRYVFCYMALLDELDSETEKLNIEVAHMSRKIQEENDNGKIIEYYVLEWQNDAKREIQKSEIELSASCSCIEFLPIPDPVSRFRIGRNAANKAKTIIKFTAIGKDYLTGQIAQLPPFDNRPKSDNAYTEFESRKDIYQKLYDGLVNKDSPLVHGIYGMAGAGKTRMMEKFWEDAMNEKIFDKVVRINVGNENFNEIKLQDQIAGCLNCHFNSQDVERRASQLEQSLRNKGKILLILDDVWTEIPLDNIIGTPFSDESNSKGSKILLTSRQKDVLELNNKCEHLVEVKTLSPGEALYLFQNAVGTHTLNSLNDDFLVQEVCFECGRLPLHINAVGKALKGKRHNSWKDARDQLKKGHFEKIPGVPPRVNEGIKLSIDYLEHDDAKSCLFLCSLFPEDANIDMKMLIQLAIGSQLIPDGELRVLAMVDSLKASSLLLDSGRDDDETKVHDIIRDVARSMASTDSKYAFLHEKCNSRYFPSNAGCCTGKFLRLDAETHDVHFKEDLICPDLHTLWLQSNNHPQQFLGGFFRMFVNLRFLMLQKVNISLEKFSLQLLRKLETLSLIECDISKTDVSLFPKNLVSLWIYKCELPSPLDVANLEYLQKLEIQQGNEFVMPSSASVIISSLACLKELHMSKGLITEGEEYRSVVMEISKLTDLTSLKFHFYGGDTFQGRDVFSNLDRYSISVGEGYIVRSSFSKVRPVGRSIELHGYHWKTWDGLMARAEEVILGNSSIEVSSICKGRVEAFEDLTRLYINSCHHMGYLASISHDEIHNEATCFSKLTILDIQFCFKLKYLFCNNIAKGLVHLQYLCVRDCNSMEAIIMNDSTSDREIIEFPKLRVIQILSAGRLARFYGENKKKHGAGSAVMDNFSQHQPLFNQMVVFPSLEELTIGWLPNTSVIWGNDCFDSDTLSSFSQLKRLDISSCDKLEIVIPEAMLHRLNNLEYIDVIGCKSLRAMFPLSVATALKHLKKLEVGCCEKMTDIIEAGEQVISCQDFILPQLSSIVLEELPGLKRLFHGANFEFHLPNLKEVEVKICGLSTLFTFFMFRNFQLKKLKVKKCELLEKIVEDVRGDETCNKTITLSQLTAVTLSELPNLKSFFHNANYEFDMLIIEKVIVHHCGLSNTLFTRSVFKNLKQLKTLKVSDCGLLEGIFEDAWGDVTLNTSDKIITLNQVSTVFLDGLPKFKSMFCGATFECYMPALKKVKIVRCGLSVLFTCSVFEKIQQLEELHVSNCDLLEHIVEEIGGGETSEVNGMSVTYSKLSSITLESLPNLKSFSCSSSCVFNMPRLKNFRLIKCPQIEYFSSSKTNTASVSVTSDYCSGEKFQDLNDYTGQYVSQERKLLEWLCTRIEL